MYYKKKRLMVFTIISLFIAAGLIYFFLNKDKKVEETVASCPWIMQTMPNDDSQNRWVGSGVLAIKNAKNDLEAKVGLEDWLSYVKVHRELLIPSYKMFFPSNTGSLDEILVSRAGECASPRTVAMVNEMRLAAASLGTVKLGDAPANGFNTGVEKKLVVMSAVSGVYGDRKAIVITFKDGRILYILARCGNVVLPGRNWLPVGKTDNVIPPPPVIRRYLKPKSKDVTKYQRPGADSKRDAGVGVKPKVVVTQVAEKTPPVPVTQVNKVVRGRNIVNKVTDNPIAEVVIQDQNASPAPVYQEPPANQGGGTFEGTVSGF